MRTDVSERAACESCDEARHQQRNDGESNHRRRGLRHDLEEVRDPQEETGFAIVPQDSGEDCRHEDRVLNKSIGNAACGDFSTMAKMPRKITPPIRHSQNVVEPGRCREAHRHEDQHHADSE